MESYFRFAFCTIEEPVPYSQRNSNKEYDNPWTQMVTPKEANKEDTIVESKPRLLASVTCNRDKR